MSELFYIFTHNVVQYGLAFLFLCLGCFVLSISLMVFRLLRKPGEFINISFYLSRRKGSGNE